MVNLNLIFKSSDSNDAPSDTILEFMDALNDKDATVDQRQGPDRITDCLSSLKNSGNESKRLCCIPKQSSVLAQLWPRISVVGKYQSAPCLGVGIRSCSTEGNRKY